MMIVSVILIIAVLIYLYLFKMQTLKDDLVNITAHQKVLENQLKKIMKEQDDYEISIVTLNKELERTKSLLSRWLAITNPLRTKHDDVTILSSGKEIIKSLTQLSNETLEVIK